MKTLLSLISILITLTLSACGTQSTEPTQTTTYEYTVTEATNGQYYATATDQTGLYFTESELIEPVKVGDTITATFEGKEVDSPFTVELK